MVVQATEVKTRGVSIFDEILQKFDEVVINVRGKNRYVVVDMDRYNHLREAELEMAYLETMRDYENGDYKIVSAKEHIQNLKRELDV
jgi:PHD/YefM family antitoxin component YafN of YafNO toxin-antitoxin module